MRRDEAVVTATVSVCNLRRKCRQISKQTTNYAQNLFVNTPMNCAISVDTRDGGVDS